jgi:hypothetical protein
VGKASSAKKVAKVAESARGVKVREPRGKVFPVALAAVIILGTLLVAWSRQSSIAAAGTEPLVGEHWHVAYGVYNCDKWLGNVQTNSETGTIADTYKVTGIHTHGDGVVHIHPFGSNGVGKNAKLGTFMNMIGGKLTDTKLEMPEGLGTLTNGEKCGDKPASLRVLTWESTTNPGTPKKYLTDFNSIRFTKNGMAVAILFMPDDATDAQVNGLLPPSAANLEALGAADGGASAATIGASTTVPVAITVPGETTVAGATTVASATTVAASTSSSTAG